MGDDNIDYHIMYSDRSRRSRRWAPPKKRKLKTSVRKGGFFFDDYGNRWDEEVDDELLHEQFIEDAKAKGRLDLLDDETGVAFARWKEARERKRKLKTGR